MKNAIDNEKLDVRNCPLCGSSGLRLFYSAIGVPASCNRLWVSREDAINCPKGDIKLEFCPSCTFISNMAIEPEKNQYDSGYDNSLFYSAHFQEFAKRLASNLVERYGLYGKNILEIGGGKVDFLTIFVGLGNNCGFRFNPFLSTVKDKNQNKNSSEGLVSGSIPFLEEGKKIDFVFSYHEFEHMNDPKKFLKDLRTMLGQSASVRVFFSVPNALKAFDEGDYSDIIYEHVSYFTNSSLYFIFSSCGFDISTVEETEGEIFDSVYVDATLSQEKLLELRPNPGPAINEVENRVRSFAAKTVENIRSISLQLTELLEKGNRIVVWGAGARGVTFLNIFKDQRIEFAVDINPHKQGMYVPGTGQKIVSPEFLLEYRPDFILLANPAYSKEIKCLLDELNVNAKFISI